MEIKRDVGYIRSRKCPDVYTESQTEHVLPDYLGDVRKLLFTSARVRPSAKFAGGEEVECSGVVVYSIIYLDSDNNISSEEFTSDYDYSVKCSAESYRDSVVDTRVSNYAIRLMGPRKISAKASLTAGVRLMENENISVTGDSFDLESDIEVQSRPLKIRRTLISPSVEREYAESVASLEGAIADEVSVIYSDVNTTVESAEYEDSAVSIKGKIRMMAMVKNGEAGAFLVEKVMNYEESVPFDDADATMKFIPELTVASVKSSVNANDNGAEVVISGIIEMSVTSESNQSVEVVTDGYLKSCATQNSYEDFTYSEFIDCITVKGSHNAQIPRSEIEASKLREIIFLTATPKVESVKQDGCTLKILGEIRYNGVASDVGEGDELTYISVKFSSPFATNVNIDCQNSDNLRCDVKVVAHSVSAGIDSENIYASCVLESSAVAFEEKSRRILVSSGARENEPYEKNESTIKVYYPTSDDTLFSVAKKFHSSTLKIAKDNSIAESVFASDNPDGTLVGVKKLLIF